jgi:uncharacterized protein YcbK (DUF882 family)
VQGSNLRGLGADLCAWVGMTHVSKRDFLMSGLASGAAALATGSAKATDNHICRQISVHNLHTGERQSCLYFDKGAYVPQALAAMDAVLRDWRTGDVHPIDAKLYDQMHQLQVLTGQFGTFNIICGYRSPKTNAALHQNSSGVATHSQHLLGKAIDLNLDGADLGHLKAAALSLKAGGVGYYLASNFVHIDTGAVRSWG